MYVVLKTLAITLPICNQCLRASWVRAMDVSEVQPSASSGTVHGVVIGQLSLIKTSSRNPSTKYPALM